MKNMITLKIAMVLLMFAAISQAREPNSVPTDKIIISGTGDSQELLRVMAKAFMAEHNNCGVEIPDSIGSTGGIKALLRGEANFARVARLLKDDEKKQGLTYHLFAKSPLVFVVNPSVADINNITAEQIIGIYSGKITNWGQLGGAASKIHPVTREITDSSVQILEKTLPGFADVNSQAAAKVIYTTPEMVSVIAEHKGTIGFVPLSMTKGIGLKILKIDGVYPSTESVISGEYKYIASFGIVYKGKLKGFEKKFVEFIYSEDGQKIITDMGSIPAKQE